MRRLSIIKKAALTTVAGLTFLGGKAYADGIALYNVNIELYTPAVVVVPDVVVGCRGNLYSADVRLRLAEADEFQTHRDLKGARIHEGEIAAALADQQGAAADLRQQLGDVDANLAAARDAAAHAADDVVALHKRMEAFDHRIAGAREDLKAAHELHDDAGVADAESRIKKNEDAAAAAADELHAIEGRAAALQDAEARAAGLDDLRARLHAADDRVAVIGDDLAAAHEAVYRGEQRLAGAHDAVCVALHDRDESLWCIYRDQLVLGVCDPGVCGFTLDLGYFGGHLPRDPEALHAYFVHDAGYWHDHAEDIVVRIDTVNRIHELVSIRDIERVKEVDRITQVEKVEKGIKVEDRREVFTAAKVERERVANEGKEREVAAKEGRKPNVTRFVANTHPNLAAKLAKADKTIAQQSQEIRHDAKVEEGDKHEIKSLKTETSDVERPTDTGGRHRTPEPNATTPDTGGRHHSGDPSTPAATPDTGGRHHTGDPSTPSPTPTPDTGGRHHTGDPSTPSPTPTPDTGGRHHTGDSPTPTPTPTPDTGGRHHSGDPSTPTPSPTPTPDTGRHHSGDPSTPSPTPTPDPSGRHHTGDSPTPTPTPPSDTGGRHHTGDQSTPTPTPTPPPDSGGRHHSGDPATPPADPAQH